MRFYAILNELGWRERIASRLELKKGEETTPFEKPPEPLTEYGLDRANERRDLVRVMEPEKESY